MKFFRSFKFTILQNQRWVKFRYDKRISYYYRKWPPAAVAYVLGVGIFTILIASNHSVPQQPDTGRHSGFGYGVTMSLPGGRSLKLQNRAALIGQNSRSSTVGPATSSTQAQDNSLALVHNNIITTYFWVGEPGDSDNGNISNTESTWDGHWQADYGGVDSPTGRNGYLPGGFTPKENPFYFALPYSDITSSGQRKASGVSCLNSNNLAVGAHSWCKNTWIAISHGGKTVYAQWEDAGPFGEDDTAYVFGSATPANTVDTKAGLDVSPAIRDYLGLADVDNCSWSFISAANVPTGPWKTIISTDLGDNTVN
jgi:hypothetical protein